MMPQTFLVGYTTPDIEGLQSYLIATEQFEFYDQFAAAIDGGVPPGMALCSFYAKLCYKSLVLGRNANVSKIRDIEDNIASCFNSGHGSVFEHCWLNFITTDCSRVFTHELVRHRVGTAFSQTSGRYVALDESLRIVLPPDMAENVDAASLVESVRQSLVSAAMRLREILIPEDADFATKKKLTSAIRRIAPNGQTNEIGWSCNVRSLRHMLEMRTGRHAEWEIRVVFAEVASIIENRWPLMLYGGKSEIVDGIPEWTGLRV